MTIPLNDSGSLTISLVIVLECYFHCQKLIQIFVYKNTKK